MNICVIYPSLIKKLIRVLIIKSKKYLHKSCHKMQSKTLVKLIKNLYSILNSLHLCIYIREIKSVYSFICTQEEIKHTIHW